MIGLENYSQGFAGDEMVGQQELSKAMQAGQITGRDTTGLSLTQEPLKVESLEAALKVLEFRTQDIKLFNALPKKTAYNTVEEYLQLASYGAERGGFYDEGELSDVEDSTYIRRAEHVKYMQVTGEVTLQAQMVRSYVDAMRQEVQNKMMWVLRLADRALTKGDSDVIAQEFNSIYKQHQSVGTTTGDLYADNFSYYNSGTVLDLRGESIKQEHIEQAAVQVDLNYGTATSFFGPTTMVSTLSQDYFNRQRILFGPGQTQGAVGQLGTVATSIATTLGSVSLNSDKFMKADPAKDSTSSATSAFAPSAPSIGGVSAVADDPQSLYQGSDAGNVFYAVSALNKKGESTLTIHDTAVTIAAGTSVDIEVTPTAGANPTQGFVVYRTEVTNADDSAGLRFFPIFKVSAAHTAAGYDGASANTIRDRGMFLPNTDQGFVAQMDDEVLAYKQLAPISKLDLAILAPSRRFIVFSFGTPVLFQPRKLVRIINAGKKLTQD